MSSLISWKNTNESFHVHEKPQNVLFFAKPVGLAQHTAASSPRAILASVSRKGNLSCNVCAYLCNSAASKVDGEELSVVMNITVMMKD